MLVKATKEMGFHSEAASSAEAALRLMEHTPFPVIVVDLNLPGAGGLDLLETVRARWPDTQAIILTGFGDLQAARRAIHLEVVEFLTKPCALGDLEIALGRAYRRLEQLQPSALDPKYADIPEDDEEESTGQPSAPAEISGGDALAFAPRNKPNSFDGRHRTTNHSGRIGQTRRQPRRHRP